MPKAGAAWLEPKVGVEFCAGEAPVKLNEGPPVDPDALPKEGALLLLWLAPNVGADVLLGPPNWNGLEPLGAAEVLPKLNMPPDVEVGAEPELPPLLPEAKGLLKEDPEFPDWNENPPDPELLVVLAAPKLVLAPLVVPEPPPKMGAAGVVEAFPKLKMGAADAPVLPPLKAFLAGEGSSCFMGLPPNKGAPDEAGDLGVPKRGFAESEMPLGLAPKLKIGAAAGLSAAGASVLGAVDASGLELGAPNRGFAAGVVDALPNRLVAFAEGLTPNRDDAGVVDSPPKSEVLGAVEDLSPSAGLTPKRVDDCITGPLDSAGLLTEPNRLVVDGVLGLSSNFAPNKLEAGLVGSASLGVSAGLGAKREDPKLG